MCDPSFIFGGHAPRREPSAPKAACVLARLMEHHLGYAEGHIDPEALRLFVRAYWGRIAPLAHAIHEGQD